jgi:hypothetical protein
MRELSGEERQINIFKNKFRESDNPEIQMMILDALATYRDRGIEAIRGLIKMTNIEEVQAHGLKLIGGFKGQAP